MARCCGLLVIHRADHEALCGLWVSAHEGTCRCGCVQEGTRALLERELALLKLEHEHHRLAIQSASCTPCVSLSAAARQPQAP